MSHDMIDTRNRETSAAEVAAFKARAARFTESYTAYLALNKEWRDHCGNVPMIGADGRDVRKYILTTFMGDKLAEVTSIKSRRERRSWLTDTRGSFWARGIDGRLYHGRHNGVGMYCRMRLAKNQSDVR